MQPISGNPAVSEKESARFTFSSDVVEKASLVVLPLVFLVFNGAYWSWFLTGSEAAMPRGLSANGTL